LGIELFTFQLSGCEEEIMAQAKSGDTVRINYTGRLDDGTVFKTSCGYKPLKFRIGKSMLIPAFQETVVGMKPGKSRTVKIAACEAYGPRREQMVATVDRNKFPENVKPSVGLELDICQQNGKVSLVKVIDVSECSVTLDANHPLAGKDLTFDIELVEII
jgi:peptidylprolyl isomerase